MINFKGHRIKKAIILICIRWYLAYPAQLPKSEGDDGRARCAHRPHAYLSLGSEIHAKTGGYFSQKQNASSQTDDHGGRAYSLVRRTILFLGGLIPLGGCRIMIRQD